MADNISICPKAPDEEIMHMLIRANQFLNHAKGHALSNTEFDVMIAIHNLDNAIEYTLRILIRHFDVENLTGKNIDTCEIDVLIGELRRFFVDQSMPALPLVQEIKLIRKQRNMVQHAMTNPASDLKIYIGYGEKFFQRTLGRYFGIAVSDLRFSTLIKDAFVKDLIRRAEEKIDAQNYIEAIVDVRDAFDYAAFQNPMYRYGRLMIGPTIVEAKGVGEELPHFLSHIHDTLWLTAMSVDMSRYNRYLEYTEYIPSEYCKGNAFQHLLQRGWERRDADFCYLFVCETILQWQTMDTSDIDAREDYDEPFKNCVFTDLIEGVDIRESFESKGCTYGLNKKMGKLFFVNSEEKLYRIKAGSDRGYLRHHFTREENGEVSYERQVILHSLGIDWKLVMNNPETWQVFLLFEEVPFTKKCHVDLDQVDIDVLAEDECVTEDELIASYLPVLTMDKAIELKKKMEGAGIDPDRYYSSRLIETLIKEEAY